MSRCSDDEWIDADSHRLQPFMSRARLAARPHVTRPHPGHAMHSINLDSLLGIGVVGNDGSAPTPVPGAQPSPSLAQYIPSVANAGASATNSYQENRQLAFDLSAAIAAMGETLAAEGAVAPSSTSSSSSSSSLRPDCSSQLRTFALKLHKAIDSDSSAGSSTLDSQRMTAYALTDRMLSLVAPHASHPTSALRPAPSPGQAAVGGKHPGGDMLPISLTVNAIGGGTSSGSVAIAAACAAGILPHPSQFAAQSITNLSCLAELSARNHSFIDQITVAYEREQARMLTKQGADNFRAGLSAQVFKNVPFAQEQAGFTSQALQADSNLTALPPSLRPTIPASASLPLCSYLLQLIQQQLLHKPLLPSAPTPSSLIVSAAQPRGRIAELNLLVPLSMTERVYIREVRAFLMRLMELPPSHADDRAEMWRVRHAALATFFQLSLALSSQEAVEDAILQLLLFFRPQLVHMASGDAAADSSLTADEQRDLSTLLHSMAALTQQWARCTTAGAQRLLGQQREEFSSGLSEARCPTVEVTVPVIAPAANPAAATPTASTAATSSPSPLALEPAVTRWSAAADLSASPPLLPLFPSPSSMPTCPQLHPPPLSDSVCLCTESSGAYLFILNADYGLLKMGTGESGSIAGQIARQNIALALHAPFANITFVPDPNRWPDSAQSQAAYGTRGHLLLRSQLCPDRLLLINADTLQFTGAYIPLNDESDVESGAATQSTSSNDDGSSSSSSISSDASDSASVSYSWELSYTSSGASSSPSSSSPGVGSGYDPTTLPAVVYPPGWHAQAARHGFILDAQDCRGDWFPAMSLGIVEGDSSTVNVQFDGWGPQHCEKIAIHGGKLAPFGSRINPLQRFSNSKQQGDQLLDLSEAMRAYKREKGRDIFTSPNLNTPDFVRSLRVGSAIDARDSSQMWYAAQVVKLENDIATVRYDGWKKEYDEGQRTQSTHLERCDLERFVILILS